MSYVLLVDDEDDNLVCVRELLTANGFEHASTMHGEEALRRARRAPPSIVISDVLMPVMDGYALLRQWKADPTLHSIPFVVFAASYMDEEDKLLALGLGADAFIARPYDAEELILRVRQLTQNPLNAKGALLVPGMRQAEQERGYGQDLVRRLEAKTLQLHASNRALLEEIEQRHQIALTQISLLDAITAHVCLIDSSGVIVAVNEAWRRYASANLLRSPEFSVGDNYLKICEEAGGGESTEAREVAIGIRAVLSGGLQSFVLEYPCRTEVGISWFRLIATPLQGGVGIGAVIMHVDVTDRRGAEKRHEESEAQYLLLLNSTAEGIYRLDMNGICTFCNPTAARLLGYDDPARVVGHPAHQHHHHVHPDGTAFRQAACQIHPTSGSTRGVHTEHEVFIRADGSVFPVECWAYPILAGPDIAGTVVTFLDITQRQSLEAQFLQSQKMEAIGRLAGGVAHDFNNALQVILTYGELLEERLVADELGTDHTKQIMHAGRRAASLTQQLLTLSRQQIQRPTLLEISSAASDIEDMLRMTIGEDIKLVARYDAKGGTIVADRGQIQQILINLAINARDAMPSGGVLTISTSTVHIAPDAGQTRDALEPGNYVMLSIRDTGTGMDLATQGRIFEPFFTTKPPAKGTGLGLSTVYGIVKQSKGSIVVDSAIGQGSDFRLYFPLVPGAPDLIAKPESTLMPRRGSETIFLVEDEGPLRSVVRDILRANGYRVLEAVDGNSAVATGDAFPETIELLLSDVILPGLSGRGVADHLRVSRPDMKVIYMSGYTDDYIAEHGVLDSRTILLEKPFSIALLLLKIREHLDSASPNHVGKAPSRHSSTAVDYSKHL